ncbi:carbohydrate ABC transporter permease [Paenibacillus radicis (ex Xue et al. 2023)]|uniref:Carbohydrate ABC transporter permease n=1 Tax=Paenibacillus radicis (ex Xue et al. 2023) TaxID=2972489 RepID=A0ABT1YHH1_9BACL|nr:carbohydrate ABC transporter permease [Paenibacillus radicis (ex Xue et al. 2023)]MCR8632641.1 carbohydrate ABC transporter permease [Paenibacillus radicis (ex Xue et al. 2023)]
MNKSLVKVIQVLVSLLLMLFILFPLLWLILSSVKLPLELFSNPPKVWPGEVTFKYYLKLMTDPSFNKALLNSFIVAVFTTVISLAIGTLGAYAFARFKFPRRNAFLMTVLASQMLPHMALLIPLFMILRISGLLYTYQGLIITYISFSLPYVVWMFRAFIYSIPYEIEEAAKLDGCSRIQVIRKIVLPLSLGGLVTTGIFVFIGAWNEFLFASAMTNTDVKTLSVRMAEFIGEDRIAYEIMFPAGVVASLPVLILVLFFQKYIVRGLTEGGVK